MDIARLTDEANRTRFMDRVKQLRKDFGLPTEVTGQELLDRLRKDVDAAMMKIYWDIQEDYKNSFTAVKGSVKAAGLREKLDREGFLTSGITPKEEGLSGVIGKDKYKNLPRMDTMDALRDMTKREEKAMGDLVERPANTERTQSILRETLTVVDAAEQAAGLIGCELTIQTLEYKNYGMKVEFTIRKTVSPTDDKYRDAFGTAQSEG